MFIFLVAKSLCSNISYRSFIGNSFKEHSYAEENFRPQKENKASFPFFLIIC